MYLTRFKINQARRDAQRLLSRPQAMHATVLASFPDASPTEEGRILYRIDPGQHNPTLLVSSPRVPDLTHLVEQAGWQASGETWETRDYEPLLTSLKTGRRLRFRFTGNPVVDTRKLQSKRQNQSRDTLEKPRRVGHVTPEQKLTWLHNREAGAGVSFEDTTIVSQSLEKFARQGGTVTLAMATFEGVLEVKDADLLQRALRFGIGHGKAYGCGMMTLARL